MKYDIAKYNRGTSTSQGKILSLIMQKSTVLEMGAATGYMTKELRDTLHCDVDIVEIDPEGFDQAVQYARKGYCGDLNKDEWFQTFQGNQYDYILFADVLEHLSAPQKALKKAVELLKDDGTIIISIPNIGHNDILLKLAANEWNYTPTGLLDDTHIHFWGRENLEPFLADAGLKIVLLDATYLGTCDTEQFRKTNSKVDTALYNVISQRPHGEIYQFVLCAQKQQYAEQKGIEMVNLLPDEEDHGTEFKSIECNSTVFFAKDGAYSADRCLTKHRRIFGQGSLIFPLVWELNVPAGCDRVRLDPCENWNCVVSKVNVICDGQLIMPVPLNGMTINGHLVFATEDPQIELRLPGDQGYTVYIEMQVQMLDPRNPLIASIEHYVVEAERNFQQLREQEITALQGEINKLMTDRSVRENAHQEELGALHTNIENLEKAREATVNEYNKACAAYERQAEELKQLREQEQEELGVLRANIENLAKAREATVDEYNKACAAYERQAEELKQLREQEKEALQGDIARLLADRDEREKVHQEEVNVLHANMSNLENARAALIDEYNKACAAYEKHAEELKQLRVDEKLALQNDIQKLMEDRYAHDCCVAEETKSLMQQIEALKKENIRKSHQMKKADERYNRTIEKQEKKIMQAEQDKKISNEQAYEIGRLQGERQHLLHYVQKAEKAYNEMLLQVARLEAQCELKDGQIQELDLLRDENGRLTQERDALLALHNERETELARQIGQLEAQCVAYDRHVTAIQQEHQNREQQLSQERDTFRNQIQSIQIENAALREEAQKCNYNFQLISNSQWWKLTAPGRKAMIAMKSTRLGGLLFKGVRSLKNEGVKKTAKKAVGVMAGRRSVPGELPPADCNAFIKQLQQHRGVICDLKKLQAYLQDTKPYQYRVLFVSHEMSLTGAPLVLMNFAKMVHESGNQAVIVSPVDGPLRAEAERFGIPVAVVPDLFASNDTLDLVYPFNLVVACTIASAKVVKDLNGMDIPVVWWIHEAMVSYHPGFLANMPQTLEKNIHVYSVCEYAKNMLLKFRPQYDSNILPYYMDDFANVESNSSFALPPHGNKKVFTMVGSMEVRKGQDILVNAIRMLPRNILEKCLFVIVAKKYHEPFAKMVDDLCEDYPQNVIYYEQLSRDDIANLYKETDCLLCASRDDPLPCVITEALAVGKPAICSEHTGYAAILKEMNSGLVYKNDDPQLLAEAIEKYLTKPNLQKKLQRNTRSTYEKHFTQKVFNERATTLLNRHILHLTDAEVSANDIGSMSLQQLIEMTTPTQKSVSVVIPTYNAGEQFETLLTNLEKQKGIDQLEIVIVDSGSKDKTVEISRNHGVKLIQIPNEQFSHSGARNMGAKAASGEILLFMTQDAMPVGKDWIEKLITPIVNENVAAVSPIEKCPPETDLYYKVASSIHVNYLGNSKANLLNEGMADGDRAGFRARSALNDVTTAINRKVFLRFQYRHDFAEDLDMGMRLIRSGYRVMLMSSVQTLHGHNRAAGYYFKRTLVDTVTTSQTILQMPVAGTCAQWDLAEMLGQGYGAMQWVYSTVLSDKYDSIDQFHDALLKTFGRARKLSAGEMKSEPTNADIHDDIMQAVAKILASFYMENGGPRYEVVSAMEGYWQNALYPYAKKNVHWSADQAKEMLLCINKQLACTMGCELARLSPDDSMYPQIHHYTAGV